MQKDYLFVYGTLRKNYDLKLKEKVASNITYVAQAKLKATLYDIGKYPGAIKENNYDEVVGDVFLLNDSEKAFEILDNYEGEEYVRKKSKVQLRSGKTVIAWVYWYNQEPLGKQRIAYKDYLNYLRNKKTA